MILRSTLSVLLITLAATAAQAQTMMPSRPQPIVPILPAMPAPAQPGPVTIVQLPNQAPGTAKCYRVQNCTWNRATQTERCLQPACAR